MTATPVSVTAPMSYWEIFCSDEPVFLVSTMDSRVLTRAKRKRLRQLEEVKMFQRYRLLCQGAPGNMAA